jgi:hypothetical protein
MFDVHKKSHITNSKFQFFGAFPDLAYQSTTPASDQLTTSEETSISSESEPLPRFVPATWPELETHTTHNLPRSMNASTMPETIATLPKNMSGRNHPLAPKFNGKPASLSVFLDEIKTMTKTCRLTQKQTIDWAVRYAPSKEHELWGMQEAVGTNDWEQFKKELYDPYPGLTGE